MQDSPEIAHYRALLDKCFQKKQAFAVQSAIDECRCAYITALRRFNVIAFDTDDGAETAFIRALAADGFDSMGLAPRVGQMDSADEVKHYKSYEQQ